MVWVIWLDKQGKWHSWEEITIGAFGTELSKESMRFAEDTAIRDAKMLVGEISGTADFIASAIVAYCIHARKRHQAIKLAKDAFKRRLISV